MELALPEKIDRDIWAGMLGRGEKDPGPVLAYMDECEKMLFETAQPRGVYVFSDDMDYEGKAIARHLEGCRGTVLLGMTLGRSIDERLTRLQVSDLAMGVVFDSGASLLAEAVCDGFEEIIRQEVESKGMFMTKRFSPGYGDLPLYTQKKVIAALDASRQIGLTLSESDLMIPMKSVTAICGISERPVTGSLATCEECVLRDSCEKRKEGKTCADT